MATFVIPALTVLPYELPQELGFKEFTLRDAITVKCASRITISIDGETFQVNPSAGYTQNAAIVHLHKVKVINSDGLTIKIYDQDAFLIPGTKVLYSGPVRKISGDQYIDLQTKGVYEAIIMPLPVTVLDNSKIAIKLVSSDRRLMVLPWSSDLPITYIKACIELEANIPMENQHLTYRGQILKSCLDYRTLGDYGIKGGSVLRVTRRHRTVRIIGK